jgi:hypothetical protein
MIMTVASVAVAAIACGKDKSPTSTAMSADLKRDLQLASATQDIRINPDEVAEASKPEVSVRPRRAPQGPTVVRTEQPTVQASAAPVEAAEVAMEIPQPEVMATAPAPSESQADAAPPLARPTAAPIGNAGSGDVHGAGTGTGTGTGTTAGTILGGIFGAVIRGGRVGDDDHCDPRPRNRGIGGDVYYPNGRSFPAGMGGSRVPIRPMTRQR